MSEEDTKARQKNEFEAIKAIYDGDLKDHRGKSAAKRWEPLNLSLTLMPQQGNSGALESHVKVDLHIICDETYPLRIPKILLESSHGLSKTNLDELKDILEKKARELEGEELIFELSRCVEEFLYKHNKRPPKSFYDEMLKRRKEEVEKDLQEKKIEEDRQRQRMIEEVQRREEILKAEGRKLRENRQNPETEEVIDTNRPSLHIRKRDESSAEDSDESLCQHKGTIIIHIAHREIQRGRCLRHSANRHTTFSGIDRQTGEFVVMSEWNVEFQNKNDVLHIQKQISSIEQEFNYLTKLKHPNLADYYNIEHQLEENGYNIYLLKEFICGSNCFALYLCQNIKIDVDFLKHIAKGILTAIDFLHRNNVVHKDIKDTCVYLSETGIVKISNYSIHRRLSDLNSHVASNYGKKTDIYKFGLLLLSLLQGNYANEDKLEIPSSIQSDLYDFLTRCLAKQESDRYTTSQLLNHSFFQIPIVHFSPKHFEEVHRPKNSFDENELPLSRPSLSGQSRINCEFEFLQYLGKGGFGDVIKVRNKLDGGYYAIKRIQLKPKNRTLHKKIVREVKLLSKLNHENVVRYYNSWIETETIDGTDSSLTENSVPENIPIVIKKSEFSLKDDIEALAPPVKNVEGSLKYDGTSEQVTFNSSSDEESSDEDEPWRTRYREESESDGIEFERNADSLTENESPFQSLLTNSRSTETTAELNQQIEFMYIQMEFCEKSTLRTAIDDDLYLDEGRLWRLFREIVEGLAHIHQQGMIHRDLKPVNIFLDSEDHVKIGDFGLATTSIKSKQNEYLSKTLVESEREDTMDESKTGLVGTVLYVAPEITSASKIVYSQKSGYLQFRPLQTSMERIKLLTKLRSKDVIFPDDFLIRKNEKQHFLLRWLLDHDISKRPTSEELLQSEHVPPPVLEERELRELIRHTLSNPQLKGYKYLIASCFTQSVTSAQDITYDKNPSAQNITKSLNLHDFVEQACVKIFQQHGGQHLATSLLMPKSRFYDRTESCVRLMTHFGSIVSLPHDLRVPFARYVAWNGITLLRRYSIERVYRERKVFGFQPRELYECAFDIVSPTQGSLMADAEILFIVYEIINELPGIKNKSFTIRLNHTSLLKAILLHCGIKDNHQEVYNTISDVKEGKLSKLQMQNYFITLELPDHLINLLLNLLNSEFEIDKAGNQFQMITKKRTGEASQLASRALQDLKIISQNAEAYGVKFEIVVSPGLVYNVQQYSGMIFQFVCELKKKHKHNNMEVVAAGGRYDSMIAWYRSIMEEGNMLSRGVQQFAVGVSISLDKLVQVLHKEQIDELSKIDCLDVVVCSVGTKRMVQEKTKILRNLWAAGFKCALLETTNEDEIQEQLNELKGTHVVMLKDNEQGTVRVRSRDKDRFQEKSFMANELVENLHRIMKHWNEGCQESISLSLLSRSESRSNYGERNSEHSQDANVDILFVTTEKLPSNARKRFEIQIKSQLEDLFKKFSGFVIVLGIPIESNVIKMLASYLEFETEVQFYKSEEMVIERYPRLKNLMHKICDEIWKLKSKRKNPTIILYSITDYNYRAII